MFQYAKHTSSTVNLDTISSNSHLQASQQQQTDQKLHLNWKGEIQLPSNLQNPDLDSDEQSILQGGVGV